MRYYELACLGDPFLLQEKVPTLIQGEGGILVNSAKKTNLISFYFQMAPENLDKLEKKLKTESQITKFLIVAKKKFKPAEAPRRTPKVLKPRQKVEIAEIEKKLEEILDES